jgi:dienelactone hydrolase
MSSNNPSTGQPFAGLVSQFDYANTLPLQASESGVQEEQGVSIHDVSYAGVENERIQGYWVAPASDGPFPAVVYVHPAPGDRSAFLEEAVQLAQQGTASLLVEAPWAQLEAWGQAMGIAERDRQNFIAAIKNLRRAVDYATSRPGVNSRRMALVGHSLGALCGGVLSGVEKRLKAFVLMAGAPSFTDVASLNMPTLLGPELEHYAEVMAPTDPVNFVGQAAPSALFFQFGKNDEAFSPDQFERFAQAGSQPKLVNWYDTGHFFPDAGARKDRLEWLQAQLLTERP